MSLYKLAIMNVTRNVRIYMAYFLSSTFSVTVFFTYALFAFHPDLTAKKIGVYVSVGMYFAECIIFVFSIFFILYSMGSFLKSRKKEFGILTITGISYLQLKGLVFLENMIIGIFATGVGVLVGLLFEKIFLMIAEAVLGMTKELPFYFPWQALLLTFISFLLLFVLVSAFMSMFLKRNQVVDLLKGKVKPKPEPKTYRILAFLAFVLIGTGYTLALTVKGAMVFFMMIPITIIVILGTYLLYTQLSVYVIATIKRFKGIYQYKTNMIILSDLIFRMRDNAMLFFIVTVVLTVTFSAVGTLVGIRTMLIETTRISEQGIDIVLLIGFFIGALFFISAGSFLYFRLYTDLEEEKQRYRAIAKLGLTEKELSTIITVKLAVLFFVPFIIAAIHGFIALISMQHMFDYGLIMETIIVLGSFLLIQWTGYTKLDRFVKVI